MIRLIVFFLSVSLLFAEDYLRYSVQLATFKTEKGAYAFMKKVQKRIKNRRIFLYKTDDGFFTLRIGVEKEKRHLRELLREVRESGFRDARIVPTDIRKLNSSFKEVKKTKRVNYREKLQELVRRLKNFIEKLTSGKYVLKPKKSKDIFFKLAKLKVDILKNGSLYLVGEIQARNKKVFSEDYSPIRWRAGIGLEFDLLRQGFFENKREIELIKLRKIERKFLVGGTNSFQILKEQKQIIGEFYLKELSEMYRIKREFLFLFKSLFKELVKLDKGFSIYLKLVSVDKKYLRDLNDTIEKRTEYYLPIVDIDLSKLLKLLKSKRETLEKELRRFIYSSQRDESLIDFFREGKLNFYLKYNVQQADDLRDYFSFGVNLKLPVFEKLSDLRKLDKLGFLFYKQEILRKFDNVGSGVLDYALRIKQNNLHIKRNLSEIGKDLLDIERELLLLEMNIRTPNYIKIYRELNDIFFRANQIINYKTINYVNALKIIYNLNLSEKEVRELFYDGI